MRARLESNRIRENQLSAVYYSSDLGREKFVDRVLEIFKVPLGRAKKVFVKPKIVSY